MGCRGLYFAITDEQRSKLLSLTSDDEKLDFYKEAIEGAWEDRFVQETDKAWDAFIGAWGIFRPTHLGSILRIGRIGHLPGRKTTEPIR